MNKLIIKLLTFSLSLISAGSVYAQAEVDTDTGAFYYFLNDFEGNLQYRSAGAVDQRIFAIIFNTGWGCNYPVEDLSDLDEIRIHEVMTFSKNENYNSTVNGPMWHAVWPVGPGPCDPNNFVAFGYGQFSSAWSEKVKKGKDTFSYRDTASGYLFDLADSCEGDYIRFSAKWQVIGEIGDPNCDLNPWGPDVSGCKKVDERVNLECPLNGDSGNDDLSGGSGND